MRIHYLQHVPFEGLSYIGKWFRSRRYSVSGTAFFADDGLPELSEFDCLVVMGGPMGVDDIAQYPWLTLEKRFIEQAIRSGKQVLGICLGAQLIAQVLGARVFKNNFKEIGWFPVSKTEIARRSPMGDVFPASFQAFHWHGDTFDLPSDAIHIAQSEACRHQVFSYGENTLGLQFHLEFSQQSIDRVIKKCGEELIPGQFIQGKEEIRRQSMLVAPSNGIMRSILELIERRCLAGMASV